MLLIRPDGMRVLLPDINFRCAGITLCAIPFVHPQPVVDGKKENFMADNVSEIREVHEAQLTQSIDRELTDEQLQQLAEGSCSWGANCNSNC
jgi:hypothetical protein